MANNVDKRAPATKETLLFVYGTLMRGGRLNGELAPSRGAEFLGTGKIRAELYRLQGESYPGAVRTSKPNRFVHGELYGLSNPEHVLERLDKIEGCDEGLFNRRLVDVWQNGKKRKAWTYFYGKSVSSAEPVPHGKFQPVRSVV